MKRMIGGLAIAALILGGCANETKELERTITNEQWIEDINFMVDSTRRIHPNPFDKIEEDTWYDAVDTLKEDIPTLTEEHIHYRMTELMAMLGDAHTQYTFNDSSLLYPLHLEYFGDELRVVGTKEQYKEILGATLISINDIPLAEIETKIDTLIAHENKQWVKSSHSSNRTVKLKQHSILSYFNITDTDTSDFTFVTQSGEELMLTLTPVSIDDLKLTFLQPEQLPISSQRPDTNGAPYWYTYLEEDESLYFSYELGTSAEQYETFPQVSQVMRDLITEKNGDMKKLIIDLRQCSGGHPDVFISLMGYLKSLQETYPFEAFVLTGKNTYSAGTLRLSEAKQYLNAISIGEETGGNANCYGDFYTIELPNSKGLTHISTKEYNLGQNDGGLRPDIEIIETFEQHSQGIDPVLDAALAQ